MIFRDEEQRLEFHKANSFMQMLVHNFEAMCYEYGIQVELMDLMSPYAVRVHAGLTDEACEHLLHKFNSLYIRQDKQLSLSLVDVELGIFQVFADDSKSFKEPI